MSYKIKAIKKIDKKYAPLLHKWVAYEEGKSKKPVDEDDMDFVELWWNYFYAKSEKRDLKYLRETFPKAKKYFGWEEKEANAIKKAISLK
jgi:hypothetical protein